MLRKPQSRSPTPKKEATPKKEPYSHKGGIRDYSAAKTLPLAETTTLMSMTTTTKPPAPPPRVEISKTEQIRDVDDEDNETPAPPPRVEISKQNNNELNS